MSGVSSQNHDRIETLSSHIDELKKSISGVDKNVAVMAERVSNIYDFIKNLDAQRERQIQILEQQMDDHKKEIIADIRSIKAENNAIKEEQLRQKTAMRIYIWIAGIIATLIASLINSLPKWISLIASKI